MHPEQLHDFDILTWREGRSHSSDKDSDPPCVDSVRINDFDAPTRDVNDRVKKFSKLIHRTYT